ncbi:alpha/beta hydrolase [Gloeothece verrucosa]|uniref:DUF1400 domain-containing protein n=1 Tax=Gloeothece verrucosa (strain PCC 7822) TaxID=497965 RepID=E0UC77_GLOV7|nr:alpha/beta hydrolase [Gloeothece verrucosa]ADN12834.1 protein of unknown function DUF1400 [Gloeothece verrucosa PCC 7822]
MSKKILNEDRSLAKKKSAQSFNFSLRRLPIIARLQKSPHRNKHLLSVTQTEEANKYLITPRRLVLPSFLQQKGIVLAVFCALIYTLPVKAAQTILFTYGPAKLSLRVESLELFAKDNIVNNNLAFYFRRTNRQQEEEFRQALTKRIELDPVVLSRFFNTEIGEAILNRFGRYVTLPGGRNGKFALRAAIISAALDPQQGLTLLNILRKLPTDVQLQGEQILGLARTIDKVVRATVLFTDVMARLSNEEAQKQQPPIDFSKLPDLRQPGAYGAEKIVMNLNDTARNRQFYVIVYKPQRWREGKTPLILFSHGLASRPEDFESLAQHLATYGYVVAMPQHPGSDLKQAKALIEGTSREVFDRDEFINRPKDISYVIDELERRNAREFGGRLDTNNVGIGGHSFGGYTALAVAGAEIDFDFLQEECERPFGGLNTSLLLQCRALALPRQVYNFRDPRIKMVVASNPVNSSIFGQKGLAKIEIPILLASGNYDPATPAVFEQVRSFVWLTTPNKFLALAEGQAHVDFSQLDAGITEVVESVEKLTLPSPDLLHSYRNGMLTAYFGAYLLNDPQYRSYFSSAYAAYLSQAEKFKLFFITSVSQPELEKAFAAFRTKER